jgi:hypothetical protein
VSVRTCASCGETVGAVADRCPSCGADPDLRLLSLGAAPAGRRGRDRPAATTSVATTNGGFRRWWPIGAVVTVAWVGLLVANGGDGGDEGTPPVTIEDRDAVPTTVARRERPAATATTAPGAPTTLAGAPLAGVPTGLTVVLGGQTNLLVDLDTGEVRPLDGEPIGATPAGLLVLHRNRVELWPSPFDGTGATSLLAGPPNGQVLPAGEAGIWIHGYVDASSITTVRFVDLEGVSTAERVLPSTAWPVGVLGDRLVLHAPGGTYLLDADGSSRRLAAGDPLWVGSGRVYVEVCDEQLRCAVQAVTEGGDVVLDDPGAVQAAPGAPAAVSSAGRAAWLDPATPSRVLLPPRSIDLDGDAAVAMAFSPDGRWLVVATTNDRLRLVDTTSEAQPIVVDTGAPSDPWQVLVVPRP